MVDTIRTYIDKHQLLALHQPVLVGLSGGADSVALLGILVHLGYKCVAVHCNFHLRGDESMRDEQFAAGFARILGVPFYKTDFDTTGYAARQHVSVEMAARELRYAWFEEMRCHHSAQAIAVAHHRDDSVETLLMNLVRGTGIRGMGGIRPKNGLVVRPLLAVSREEIVRWLEEQGYPYMTDSTNLSDAYTRNFIRLRVLPLLEEINPSAKSTIARTAEHLSAAETIYLDVLAKASREVMDGESLSIGALMRYPAPETILYELLKPYNFTRLVVADIFLAFDKEPGKVFYSSTHRLLKDRERLFLSPIGRKEEAKIYVLETEEGVWHTPVELSCRKIVLTKDFSIGRDADSAYFDSDKLAYPLYLRTWKEGDWFVPFGMKGRKKLSDFFSDRKYSRLEKEQTWLLCNGENIIWIVGERADNRFRIDEMTKNVLLVKFFR